MERRKFIKYSGIGSFGLSLFPSSLAAFGAKSSSSHFVKFPEALVQIRHGALNLPFAAGVKKEMPFDWILDVHQNIFLKNGFQRNCEEDLDITSIALEVEEGFEALQIAKQNKSFHLVWKEDVLEIDIDAQLHMLDLADEMYTFHIGQLANEESITFENFNRKENFIQVISGTLRYEDFTLTKETGLGLYSLSEKASFEALDDVCFLLVGR